jgi:hypothetical protein
MSNLPGFDFADHLIRTLSDTMLAQARVYNDAWKNIEGGNYDLKNLIADSARIYRNHFDAYRGIATFGVKNVEWQQKTIGPNMVASVSFDQPARVPGEHLAVSKADRTGGKDENGGVVEVALVDKRDGLITVEITTNENVTIGDQWIAFVYDKMSGGSPLGALLILIG